MTTNTFLFANNASTVLASPISSGSTTLTVASGTGTLFPAPATGQQFALSLTDALTGDVFEIVYVTHRSGNTMTVLRGQEGTTATSWLAGDTAANWITAGQQGAFLQRIQLQANLNIFVNGSTGSDGNNGLTSGTPFATFQFAWNYLLANYDLNGFNATITQAGTNTDTLSANGQVIGASNVSSVVLQVNGTWAVSNGTCLFANNTAITLQGTGTLTASGTGTGMGYAIAAFAGSVVNYQHITFGRCFISHIGATQSAQVSCVGDYAIDDNARSHINVNFGASVQLSDHTITLTGTPAFTGGTINGFVVASNCGTVNGAGMTFTGSATGSRYNIVTNASVDTAGSGATYFPGNAAGMTATGGQYN